MSRRLGQHFLADPNLLDAIVRLSGVEPGDVVLEVGGGAGALTERLAPRVAHLHVVELDERLRPELDPIEAGGGVSVVWGDALRVDLGSLDPAPNRIVSNLPYSVATPVILRTIEELPSVGSWTLLVQREIADRLRARPGTKAYGAPSVLVQLAAEVELLRPVSRAVFTPRPRVDSALIALRRRGPSAPEQVREVVRGAFAHRRKALARSVALGAPRGERAAVRDRVRAALAELDLPEDARAESLAPEEFAALAGSLQAA